jgi:hypothetical protein
VSTGGEKLRQFGMAARSVSIAERRVFVIVKRYRDPIFGSPGSINAGGWQEGTAYRC